MNGTCILCVQLPAASTPQAQALAEACLRFSSQVALRQAHAGAPAVFLEARRSGWLYAPESLAWRVQAAARRLGLPQPWQLGWGAHPAEAYAQARWGPALVALPDQSIRRLPLEALQAYASPFIEHGEAEQAVAGFVQVFRELGLSDLGAFLDLPLRSLETRFGAQAALLRSRVAGHWDMAWPRFEAAVVLEELADTRQVETQDGISAGEALLFHVKQLCDRVSARLGGRGQRAAGLRLSLGTQRLGTRGTQWRQIDVALPMPQAGALGLLRVLRERIGGEWRLRPLAGAITQVGLLVSASAPGLGAQRHLWDKKEEETEAWAALINRLRQRLGEDEVFLGELVQRYLPERAWKRSPLTPQVDSPSPARRGTAPLAAKLLPAAQGEVAKEAVPRPTRLLPQALPLLRQGDLLAHAPTGRRWHVRAWQGPERLSGEWWDDPSGLGFARDYFKVDTQEGEQLWVYQVSGPGGASLWWQGVFD
jgi:protein ImuB